MPIARANAQTAGRTTYFDCAAAGAYLGTGERFVRRLVAERRIPYVKIAGRIEALR